MTQGTGKGSTYKLLKSFLGKRYCVEVTEHALVESPFNSHLLATVCVYCPEIYQGGAWKAYNRLKNACVGEETRINIKGIPEFEAEVCAGQMASSNTWNALKVEKYGDVVDTHQDGTITFRKHSSGSYTVFVDGKQKPARQLLMDLRDRMGLPDKPNNTTRSLGAQVFGELRK